MEKMRLMAGNEAPNEYGNCTGRGSYETSLPGLMQLCPSERQARNEARPCRGIDVRSSESGACTASCPARRMCAAKNPHVDRECLHPCDNVSDLLYPFL